jgi:cysteine desulfuration protein SufE
LRLRCRRSGRDRARQTCAGDYIAYCNKFPEGPILTTIAAIRDDFAYLEDWEDRYRYILELGKALEPLPEASHNEGTKVRGCVSQVWIETEARDAAGGKVLHFRGDSDSHLVRGLIAITFALFSDRSPQEILGEDPRKTFSELGLESHLTPQRSNGVRSMIERIRTDARALAG